MCIKLENKTFIITLNHWKLSATEFRIMSPEVPTADSLGASNGLAEVFERKEEKTNDKKEEEG